MNVTMPIYMFISALLMSFALSIAVLVYFFNRRNRANLWFSVFLIFLVGWMLTGAFYMYFDVVLHHWVAIQMICGVLITPPFYLFSRYLTDEQYRMKKRELGLFIPNLYIIVLSLLRIVHPASSAAFAAKIAVVDNTLQRQMDPHYVVYTVAIFGIAAISLTLIAIALRHQTNEHERKRYRTVFFSLFALSITLFVVNSLANMLGRRLDPHISVLAIVASTTWMAFSVLGHKSWKIEHLLDIIKQNEAQLAAEKAKSDKLLLNILPEEVATELKNTGKVQPLSFDSASVMFTDFIGFTHISERMTPQELVGELDGYFSVFDTIIAGHGIEKLKTLGDGYMCAGGIPVKNTSHPLDIVLAALEIRAYMDEVRQRKTLAGQEGWELRIGIHTGPLVAGVIGRNKFVYDIWGDTVNTASRMETAGLTGQINISASTKNLIQDYFELEYRGELQAKNKGAIGMYFVKRLKPEYSADAAGVVPVAGLLRRNIVSAIGSSGRSIHEYQ